MTDSVWVPLHREASAEAVLSRFEFGAPHAVPLDVLAPCAPESWLGAAPVRSLARDGLRAAEDGHCLIGHLRVDADDPEQAAYAAYRRIARFLQDSAYPFLLRTWNYLDRLNEGAGDAERYRRFCVGRHRAIAQPGFEAHLPAATVIGGRVPGLYVSFLAARTPGRQIENPRQTSAFYYPREYGPVSPSFSRATRVGPLLLVSGTAAVVGHASQHPHDAAAQTGEIVTNLETLLARAAGGEAGRWTPLALRLYVRRAEDAPGARARLQAWTGTAPLAVLHGDISRADLAVEAEGVWRLDAPPA